MTKKLLLHKLIVSILMFITFTQVNAQSNFSGDLMLNYNFYQRDSSINAFGNPLYDNILSGGESWISGNYSHSDWGLRAGVRVDLFQNSNLKDLVTPYSGQGLGTWYIEKDVDKLTITAGYFYDQFGTGITYRSYEERGLGLDYATMGVRMKYRFNDNFYIKAFSGKMKNRFDLYSPLLKGAMIEKTFNISENLNMTSGASYLNRTLDKEDMNSIVANINAQELGTRFDPKYNVNVASIFNTLNYKDLTWGFEVAYKTAEATQLDGILQNKDGNVLYTTLGFSKKKYGFTIQGKRTQNFDIRTSPIQIKNDGVIDYLPPMSRQNAYRLPARYQAVTQVQSEMAAQAEVYVAPKRGLTFILNGSNITDLESELLFREILFEMNLKTKKKWGLVAGTQYINYNIETYLNKPGEGLLTAITPYVDFNYRINEKQSIEVQTQYMNCDKDFGSWLYAGVEYNLGHGWTAAISDMYNIQPYHGTKKDHYYSAFASYTHNANRFTLTYARQVEGVVCTGGVCRYEPAFSGVRLGVTSSF